MAETKLDPKQDPSPEAANLEKFLPKELLALYKALSERNFQVMSNPVAEVLEQTTARVQDQRQEQQLYASTWGAAAGVISVLTKVIDAERDASRRRDLEVMQSEMFELIAKEKKKDALRSSPFFQQLVSILGHDTAESITQKLEHASAASVSGLQSNQVALAQASKDIAALLDKNQAILGLRVSGEVLARALEDEMTAVLARMPKPAPTLSVARSEELLITKAHDMMMSLERGGDRLARLQDLRAQLGPEKFTAIVDAYDHKYGTPLVAHIANMSTSNPSLQAEMMRETLVLLSAAQQERLLQFGRAEYAQTMAVLDKRREVAKDSLRDVTAEIHKTEKVLAVSLGRPELAYLPEGAARGKVLEELRDRFPELAGKSWDETYLRLKEVAGQSDSAALGDHLRALLGGQEVTDPEALRDFIARATIQMQKLAALDQQVEVFKSVLSTNETGDEATLRKHYTAAYGAAATANGSTYQSLKKVADSHIDNLHRRIADSTLGTEERAALVRERDALEFSSVKKLAAHALRGGEAADTERALAILRDFAVAYADTPARRGEAFRKVCDHLITSIERAETLRKEWVDLDVNQFGDIEFRGPTEREHDSPINGRPARMDERRLRERYAEIDAFKSGIQPSKDPLARLMEGGAPEARNGLPGTKQTPRELLRAKREAALFTNVFATILEGSTQEVGAPNPLASIELKGSSSRAKESFDRIVAATSGLGEASANLPKELAALESGAHSEFLSSATQRALSSGLSTEVCAKLNTSTAAEAVSKLVRELDLVHDLPVDPEVLDAVRKVIPPDSEIGRAMAAVQGGSNDTNGEFEAIKARLDPINALRFDRLVAEETDTVAQGKPSIVATIVSEVLNRDAEGLLAQASEAREHARLSRVERLLGALDDEEHQEFLRFFEATTQRSVGQALIATIPADGSRKELLLRLVGSRGVTTLDIQRFYAEPVPEDRGARVAALSRAIDGDAQRPSVKVEDVRHTAQMFAYQYSSLREAVRIGMEQGDVALVGEISDKMRVIEARMGGTITKTLAQLDTSAIARSGVRVQLLAVQEQIFQDELTRQVPGRPDVVSLAKETAELLRSITPKSDAAFNRIRQANLSEEESLHLRALYAREARQASPLLEKRTLTGDLRRDLEPVTEPSIHDHERVSLLVKGGHDALREADKRTLAIAGGEQNEKRQLETLSNLRASGQYGTVTEHVSAMKLTPAAQEYHKAVVSGDTKKADAADLALKAKNGDVKPQEVASFLKNTSPQDLEQVKKNHPTLVNDLAKSNSFLNEQQYAQLLSNIAAERQRALEQAMLKSLANPYEFAAWLDVHGSLTEKRQMIRNLETLIQSQPTAPRFVENAESKIVQYVRAQRTDFREIDAHLIQQIIASPQYLNVSAVHPTLSRLREEGARRMANLDAFERPRRTVYNAAQDNLREVQRYLAEAQTDQGKRWVSGGRYDKVIALSKARVNEQGALIEPMARGMQDIETSRELVRYAFALMAKDAIAQVDRGLRPDSTDTVTKLLARRDLKIEYKITDEKRDAEWRATVKATTTSIESFDRWSAIGLGTAKVVVTVGVGFATGPWAAFAVATLLFNAPDKVYRYAICKESARSLAWSFGLELAADGFLIATTWVSSVRGVSKVFGKLAFSAAEGGERVVVNAGKEALEEVGKGAVVHFTQLKGAAKEIVDGVTKVRALTAKEGVNWVKIEVLKRGVTTPVPTSVISEAPKTIPKLESPTAAPVNSLAHNAEASLQGAKRATVDEPMKTVGVREAIVETNPDFLLEIETKLLLSPDVGVQRAVDDLRSFMSQPEGLRDDGEARLRGLSNALGQWAPYPELANALNKLLTGENPFLAFLNGHTTGDLGAPPPQPPPPPQAPPPPPPKAPDGPSGGGSGGMPGPALVVAPVVRGDSDSAPRRLGHTDNSSQPVAELLRTSIGVVAPRTEIQVDAMQQALAPASSHPIAEPRLVPNPQANRQGIQSSTYMPINLDIYHAEQQAAQRDIAMRQAQGLEIMNRDGAARPEISFQTEMPMAVSLKTKIRKGDQKANEEEISVALKGKTGRKEQPADRLGEAPRMVEGDSVHAGVSSKGSRSKGLGPEAGRTDSVVAKESPPMVGSSVGAPEMKMDAHVPEMRAHGEGKPLDQVRGERNTGAAQVSIENGDASMTPQIGVASSVDSHPNLQSSEVLPLPGEPVLQRRVVPASDDIARTSSPEFGATINHPSHHDEAHDDGVTASSPNSSRRIRKAEDARMRNLLLQQLMDQHTTKARREKILKALIALGISEVEYRKLIAKLGEMDAAKLAEQTAARTKVAEPIALAVEAPAMKESASEVSEKAEVAPVESRAQTTRAELYKRLKKEAATTRK